MRRISWRFLLPLTVLGLLAGGGCGGPKRLPPVVTDLPRQGRPPVATPPIGPALPSLLQVGLLENRSSLELHSDGAALVLDGESGHILRRLEPGEVLRSRRDGSGVAWQGGGGSDRAPAVVLQPADPDHLVRVDATPYHGELLIIPSPTGGGLTVINAVDVEVYLHGVVPWEIGRHGEDRFAAVQAQAIAARTYTIAHIGARRDRGFDVFSDVMDQVYKGAADEDPLANRAIASTAGMVLWHDGKEIEAYYSACCGGISSNIHEVWAHKASPYLASRPDGGGGGQAAYCFSSRYFAWQEQWTGGRLEEILNDTLPEYVAHMSQHGRAAWAGRLFSPRESGSDPARPGRLRDLNIVSRTKSGRVAEMQVSTDAGVYHVRGDRVRWVLRPASGNPFILRSALFDLELSREGQRIVAVVARGRGFGHGIGLCQTGALAMAEAGYDVNAILAHYYRGATLTQLAGMDSEP